MYWAKGISKDSIMDMVKGSGNRMGCEETQ